jgi:hypothetical protein
MTPDELDRAIRFAIFRKELFHFDGIGASRRRVGFKSDQLVAKGFRRADREYRNVIHPRPPFFAVE